jgi:hypothetical protein
MVARIIVGLSIVAAAFLSLPGHRADAKEPPAKERDQKEVPALAKEIVKMKVVRVENEKREDDRAEKTIEDKEKIGQLLVLFPEVGTDKKPDNALFRASGAAYQITPEREKGRGEPLTITISGNRNFWVWSQGTALPRGDWDLKQAREVGKFLDGLLK